MWPHSQFPVDLVTFTEEILNGKLHFLCRVEYQHYNEKNYLLSLIFRQLEVLSNSFKSTYIISGQCSIFTNTSPFLKGKNGCTGLSKVNCINNIQGKFWMRKIHLLVHDERYTSSKHVMNSSSC